MPLVLEKPLIITLKRASRKDMKGSVRYDAPVPAPISRGDQLGILTVTAPGIEPIQRPLLAASGVAELGPVGRVMGVTQHWLGNILR